MSIFPTLPRPWRAAFSRFAAAVTFLCLVSLAAPAHAAESDAAASAPSPKGGAGTVQIFNPAGLRSDYQYVDSLLRDIMDGAGITEPPLTGKFPDTDVESISISDPLRLDEEITALFLQRGWTDGLPIVAPTWDRVIHMLKGTHLDRSHEVAVVAPMGGIATVEKIAANAVMAGCKPEYMPILIAAVQAVTDDAFDLTGLSTTTSPDVPLIIISGPIADQVGLNRGGTVLGRGNQGNSSIGRALQLIINNVGGSRPRINDMSVMGSSSEYGMVLMESIDDNPWPLFNEDLGLPKDANAVTLMGAGGDHTIIGHGWDADGIIKLIGHHMHGLAYQRPYWNTILLVVASDTGHQLAKAGYTKEKIREALMKSNPIDRQAFADWFADFSMDDWRGILKEREGQQIIYSPIIDNFLILYAGGPGGMKNKLIPGWLFSIGPVTRTIDLPSDWEERLKALQAQ